MTKEQALSQLRDILATKLGNQIPDRGDRRRFVEDAASSLASKIEFTGNDEKFWGKLLEEAALQNLIRKVVDHTVLEYPAIAQPLLKTELLYYVTKADLTPEQLKGLYTASRAYLPDDDTKIDVNKPITIINHLWGMKPQIIKGEQYSPLSKFAYQLMSKMADELTEELDSWIRCYCKVCLKQSDESINQILVILAHDLQEEQANNKWGTAHLWIEISRYNNYDKELYNVKFAFYDRKHNPIPCKISSREIPLLEIPKLLSLQLDELYEKDLCLPTDELVLEFILPYQLFDCDVGKWVDVGTGYTLDVHHQTVIHSLDRLELIKRRNRSAKYVQGYWSKKWDSFVASEYQHRFDNSFWVDITRNDLDLDTVLPGLLTDEKITKLYCVAFNFSPCRADHGLKLLEQVLLAGMIGMIWQTAGKPPEASFIEDVQQLLNQYPLPDIPKMLHNLRNEHAGNSTHIAHSLMMLWDNPAHLPDEYDKLFVYS
jgi:hypothetical protein